jgi:excisionase family DNA binding protein
MDRILYSQKEAAQQLSVSVSTVEQLIAQGEIQIRRLGRRVLIPRSELEKLARRDVQIYWPDQKDGKKKKESSQ